MEICNIVSALANVVMAVAVLGGAIIAARGLKTWREDLHGRADFELARRVMRSVYELRTQMQQMRNVFSQGFIDTQYERLNNKASELDVVLLEAKVLWDNTLQGPKESLKKCLSTFRCAHVERLDSRDNGLELTDDQRKKLGDILDGYGTKSDQFGQEIEQAVGEFEEALRPYLKRGK